MTTWSRQPTGDSTILDAGGNPVEALLDSNGKPADATLTHMDGDVIADSPEWVNQSPPTGATTVAQGGAVFLRYQTLPTQAFASLGFGS